MGLFSTLRKRRQEKKSAMRAAKVRARAEAKADAKLEKQKEKYLRKTAKQVRKADNKELKNRRKHEEKMAQAALEQIKAGNFNGGNVTRYVGAARVAIPALLPLAYRGITQMQASNEKSRAQHSDVPVSEMAKYSGDGAAQKARIAKLRKELKDDSVPGGFAKDAEDQLDQLDKAVDSTRTMNENQTRNALKAVTRELDLVENQLRIKRG